MKHYELQLPSEYKIDKVINCEKQSTIFIFTLINFFVTAALIILGIIISFSLNESIETKFEGFYGLLGILFLILIVAVVIGHELIHGLFYKIFTKQKLTFGISLSAAFCGVPHVYVRKKAMLITCLAPCVIFSFVFLVLMIVFFSSLYYILFLVLFAVHFGGCVGDIYCAILFIFKYKNKDILINDTGLKQSIYVKNC
jgi:hypothetical protein